MNTVNDYDSRAFFEVSNYLQDALEASKMAQRNLLHIRYSPDGIWMDGVDMPNPSPDGSQPVVLADSGKDAATYLYDKLDEVLKISSVNLGLAHEIFAMPDIDFEEVEEDVV